jgi:hypothetical protein
MKKILILCVLVMVVTVFSVNITNAEVIWDVDHDGKHSMPDVIYILQSLSGIKNTVDIDDDGDGFTKNQGDCNDADNSVYPGASEICGDDIDQDCNGADLECPNLDCFVQLNSSFGTLSISGVENIPNYKEGDTVKWIGDKIGWGKDEGVEAVINIGGIIGNFLNVIAFEDGGSRFGVMAIHSNGSVDYIDSFLWCDDDKKLIVTTYETCPYGGGDPVMAVYVNPDTGKYEFVPEGVIITCRNQNGDPITAKE